MRWPRMARLHPSQKNHLFVQQLEGYMIFCLCLQYSANRSRHRREAWGNKHLSELWCSRRKRQCAVRHRARRRTNKGGMQVSEQTADFGLGEKKTVNRPKSHFDLVRMDTLLFFISESWECVAVARFVAVSYMKHERGWLVEKDQTDRCNPGQRKYSIK